MKRLFCRACGPKTAILAVLTALTFLYISPCHAETGSASYFTRESCIKEGSLTLMSNGKELDDDKFLCALWKYRLGSFVRVTNLENGKSVICEVTTRGPAKRLVRKGRIIDLSAACFKALDGGKLDRGILRKVSVERIGG